MTTENELINKLYYQTIIDKNTNEHPIKALGKMYIEEMKKEQPDLSSIRFAQGEVYYLNNDYEAAIHKWQFPLDKQFIPWARKNIADAHKEMGLLEFAENFYKEVETESVTLNSEILLQLFSLYIKQDDTNRAVKTIKEAIQLNPDYANVTEIAKSYFEDIEDWDSAVELAVNEAMRTESIYWFGVLEGYISLGFTSNYEPNYFHDVLDTLFNLDKYRFERLTDALWKSYEQSDFYFHWLEEINHLLLDHNLKQSYTWGKLPTLYKEGYFYLISGQFLINDIENLMQYHLTNWLELSSDSDNISASAAILAWHETFPSQLSTILINEASHAFKHATSKQNNENDGIELLESLKKWAEKEGLLNNLTSFMAPKLDDINLEEASPSSIRDLIKEALNYISEERKESENVILQEINWNGDLLTDLHDFQQQINDVEKEKAKSMTNSFTDFKDKFVENLQTRITKLLRNCSDLVKEDSDFSKLHLELNEEMNRRIAEHLEENALLKYRRSFHRWIETCEQEFQACQTKCIEFSEMMNERFKEEKVVLSGDFQVLDDWKRDSDRISRGLIRLEKVNILLRSTPSQLLLKGTGKLLGSLTKNKEMLLQRYKNFIENEDYSDVAREITKSFSQQLELFEESIEWDVSRFFSNPQEVLSSIIEEIKTDIEQHNAYLNELQEKPEIYHDPLTLFELKLLHYELMNKLTSHDQVQ